ncbi:MAG: hypothetical protein UDG94_06530 [Peptococcaceae bacterium]|nr:hypothetical protein [Peptococcaceae bacterium]
MMTDPRHTFENEQAFDAMLQRSVSDLPPDDIVAQTVPGKTALNRILIGYFLYTFTIGLMGLDFILPAIGQILVLLGFRALQHENRWFGFCYILEVFHAIYLFTKLFLNTTIIELPPLSEAFTLFALFINTLFIALSLFCFWRGLRSIQKKMGLRSKALGVLALLTWSLVPNAMVFLQLKGNYVFNSWRILVALIFIFILLLWIVSRTFKTLDNLGYVLQPAPVQISNRSFTLILVAILVIGSACGYLFFSSYSMAWSTKENSRPASVEEAKTHLINLGFPEYILNDLSAEDIAACEGATQVLLNSGTKDYYFDTLFYDERNIDMTNIVVLIPGEQPRLVLFHYFHWLINPGFRGTDAICLNPAYSKIPQSTLLISEVTGRVFYDNNGEHFSAPYHSIETRTKVDPIFTIIKPYDLVFANFSFPNQGENHRGYITYSFTPLEGNQFFNSQATYIHQESLLQYPAMSAESYGLNSDHYSEFTPFSAIQPQLLMFDVTVDGISLRE